ncbi:hypothetical protein IU487_33230 [Nocardia puris]|uniref:Uncharacterized protein n=1 Tax=Nocardia puris TaxID=208602 RepID=A0A366D5C8_9NOCA|nr:hypothetical protein [Nocardia puris]MBF6215863.1 hypothetical protein [Nocardia puris]RBO85243.1 hypothetical protein DFR74_11591 [Nocardia puris]
MQGAGDFGVERSGQRLGETDFAQDAELVQPLGVDLLFDLPDLARDRDRVGWVS